MATIYEDVKAIQNLIEEFEVRFNNYENDEQKDLCDKEWLINTKQEILSSGLERLCKVRTNYMANLEAFKKEEERLKARRDILNKHLDRLEGYIFQILFESKTRKQQAGTFTVSFRKSTSVFIDPSRFDDERFIHKEEVKKYDKMGVKQALQNGETITGAYLEERENLQIV